MRVHRGDYRALPDYKTRRLNPFLITHMTHRAEATEADKLRCSPPEQTAGQQSRRALLFGAGLSITLSPSFSTRELSQNLTRRYLYASV